MVTAASARDNGHASTSLGLYQAGHGQLSAAAATAVDAPAAEDEEVESTDGNRDLDLCRPAMAATITRDAERLCAQQVSREVEVGIGPRGGPYSKQSKYFLICMC